MSRTLRLFGVALAAVAMVSFVGAAYAGPGCNASTKTASAETAKSCEAGAVKTASAKSCEAGAKTASAKSCDASAKMASAKSAGYCTSSALAACTSGAKMANAGTCTSTASKMANMPAFDFVKKAQENDVAVGVQATDNGFAFVFAGGTEASIKSAKMVANKSVAQMSKPAACSYTRDAMAKKAGGCEATAACLSALADANIEMVETDNGAVATISHKEAEKVKALHEMLKSFASAEEAAASTEG
ncbi:MAG: hypothetical protein HKN21_01780 [Candidatus Eisenbacteria bacterium]|uniref:Uncharacterized protein n=1 Tax=Eiseniibacteriota bacterium TaxID=2212470 RepID=A0A7Y2H1B8_UNCEI|nr:hypothetical protein [Candidatus Eisenbacteria bacterium]